MNLKNDKEEALQNAIELAYNLDISNHSGDFYERGKFYEQDATTIKKSVQADIENDKITLEKFLQKHII